MTAAAPLAHEGAPWTKALEVAERALQDAGRTNAEVPPGALAVACAAVRSQDPAGPALIAHVRRALVRAPLGSEKSVRCLRALARAGQPVDRERLVDALESPARLARMALAALAELAAREDAEAVQVVASALDGPLRAEAAHLLASIASDACMDLLAPRIRMPGPAGVHAASALCAVEDDPFAFEVLCERLCEQGDAVLAAKALWGARPDGERLFEAEAALARWANRGIEAAEPGRLVAAALLTAGGRAADVPATFRALAAEDDELALVGALAAYALGDAERARGAALALMRRGPTVASQAFQSLVKWADLGDAAARQTVKSLVANRPVDLSRAIMLEALAAAQAETLWSFVVRMLGSTDRLGALDAARAVARLREPPALVPPTWI